MIRRYIIVWKLGNVYIIDSDWNDKSFALLRLKELKENNPDGEFHVYYKMVIK